MHLVSHQRVHWLFLQAIQNRTHYQIKKYYASHHHYPPLLVLLQLLQFCSSSLLFLFTLFLESSLFCFSLIDSSLHLTCIFIILLICFFHFLSHFFSHCPLLSHPLLFSFILIAIKSFFSVPELGWIKYILFRFILFLSHILFFKTSFWGWVTLHLIVFSFFCLIAQASVGFWNLIEHICCI